MRLEAPTQLFYPPGWVFRPLKDLWDAPPGDASSAHPNGNPQNQNQNQGSNAPSRRLLWGGQAYQVMSQITAQSNRSGTLVHRFKTMMDPSENHKRHKQDLGEILRHLSQNHTGKDPIPVEEMVLLVTIDYLTKLLEFAKGQIHLDSSQITSTEMIICVPIIWSQKAIRNMQFCMGLAAKLSGFPGVELQNKSIDNVFIMAEPEAGATWLLGRGFKSIESGTTFLLLDAGGGTVDAQTYSVTKDYPLRLEAQRLHHSGDSCGSNALNEAFFEHVLGLLDKHRYLEELPGVTVEGVARKLAFDDFEYRVKRSWQLDEPNPMDCCLDVVGLRFDPSDPDNKNPMPNRLTIRATDINAIFDRVCAKVSVIMKMQLDEAQEKNINIKGVVLMGGFAESRFLAVDAVAAGAVMRALDKEGGPRRVAKTGYGLGVFETYQKSLHGEQKPIKGIQDPSKNWIKSIKWVSRLGEVVLPNNEKTENRFWQFPYKKSDGTLNTEFVISDEIWLSDFASAEMIGIIKSDVSHLMRRELGRENPFKEKYSKGSGRRKKGARRYWEFHYNLVYKIDGLNMKCLQMRDGEVLGELGMNIASALPPGAS
ncbi:hypothetical protein ACLX1H_001239 [Fusarium chlamydosporum]